MGNRGGYRSSLTHISYRFPDMSMQGQRQPWTPEEDSAISSLVSLLGTKKWSYIAQRMQVDFSLPGRSGKQCRERWHNHLDPRLNKKPWSAEEDLLIQEAHAKLGNRWTDIAKMLPGRSDNSIKNRFHSTRRKHVKTKRRRTQERCKAAGRLRTAAPLPQDSESHQQSDDTYSCFPSSEDLDLPPLPDTDLCLSRHFVPSLPRFHSENSDFDVWECLSMSHEADMYAN